MPEIVLHVMRLVDDHFPGWAEAFLVDVDGKTWRFEEKLPVFGTDEVSLPASVNIPWSVISRTIENHGKEVLLVELAFGISDKDSDQTQFRVGREQVALD